ncbi:NAD-dependent succinate-semialdehyde dehydrogenase [Bacteroidota bacterium]
MAIQTINPATEEIVKTFDEYSKEEVSQIIDRANEAFSSWRNTTFAERKKLMNAAAAVLKNNSEKYAEIMTLEMGKPILQGIAEAEKCAWVCEYYAENAEDMLKIEMISTDATESYAQFDSLGIVLAVMPWNFPFWQVFRFAAPGLMAGNVGVLKHASNVPMCAMTIEEIFKLAGFPQNIFSTLMIGAKQVEDVINNPKIVAATLTGSEPAGQKVAESCGKVLKKTVMELGGSDPFIILDDADLDTAVETAVTARLINNGQSCIAAKRFIVVDKIADEFTSKFVERMEMVIVGNPMDKETELGPLAREDLKSELHGQVQASIEKGAELLTGGEADFDKGYYYLPTVLSNVKPGMPAYDEEMFGPVASVIKASDESDAIRIANDSNYGLGASLWTNNIDKAKELATQIETGCVCVNGMVKSDPRLPFGGVKLSGYGRELSHYGIKEFVNIKSVWIK